MHILLIIFALIYYIGIIVGLLDNDYRRKSDFLFDLIPFAGIVRISIKKYSKLD